MTCTFILFVRDLKVDEFKREEGRKGGEKDFKTQSRKGPPLSLNNGCSTRCGGSGCWREGNLSRVRSVFFVIWLSWLAPLSSLYLFSNGEEKQHFLSRRGKYLAYLCLGKNCTVVLAIFPLKSCCVLSLGKKRTVLFAIFASKFLILSFQVWRICFTASSSWKPKKNFALPPFSGKAKEKLLLFPHPSPRPPKKGTFFILGHIRARSGVKKIPRH